MQCIHSEQVAHYKDHYLYNHGCLQIHSVCNKDFEEETSFYIESLSLLERASISCGCQNFSSEWIKSKYCSYTSCIFNYINVWCCIEWISTARVLIKYCSCCKRETLFYVQIVKYSTCTNI